jgi:D-alanyl-D-alanine carboxypeptidase
MAGSLALGIMAPGGAARGWAVEAPVFASSIRELTARQQRAMTPTVWRKSCPVPLTDIRRVTITHWNYKMVATTGSIDVHVDVAESVVAVFVRLFEEKFPINKMVPIEAYGGDDDQSIDDDNTSGLNCRNVPGSKRISQHAYGRAIDVNPYRNPYVVRGKPKFRPNIKKYMNRDPAGEIVGMIYPDGPVVAAFADNGWTWGGVWPEPVDYQHFSITGT